MSLWFIVQSDQSQPKVITVTYWKLEKAKDVAYILTRVTHYSSVRNHLSVRNHIIPNLKPRVTLWLIVLLDQSTPEGVTAAYWKISHISTKGVAVAYFAFIT